MVREDGGREIRLSESVASSHAGGSFDVEKFCFKWISSFHDTQFLRLRLLSSRLHRQAPLSERKKSNCKERNQTESEALISSFFLPFLACLCSAPFFLLVYPPSHPSLSDLSSIPISPCSPPSFAFSCPLSNPPLLSLPSPLPSSSLKARIVLDHGQSKSLTLSYYLSRHMLTFSLSFD